ncbi:MAG: glycosyltransferase family 2 protein [Anaerolineae bacterium]|nr:glycosyltransferase family 2 protein [Anaerolineae bacterium]
MTESNGYAKETLCKAGTVAVIPAYNEERFIGSVVIKACKYADAVIVVDDGSTDATAEIARLAGATVIQHERNSGKGAALSTGLRAARAYDPAVVVLLDADYQHRPREMGLVTAPVLAGEADIVVGSRYLNDASDVPTHRVLGHRVFNLMTNLSSGLSVTDSQSGFRAFSPAALEAITFHSNGFSVESEMQFIAKEQGLRMTEVPITITYSDKPKRPVIAHGMLVLNGLLRMVGQYRPLFFFGVGGLLIFLLSLMLGGYVVVVYQQTKTLAVGYAMITVLLGMVGIFTMFTGVILHSVRGLVLGDQLGARQQHG